MKKPLLVALLLTGCADDEIARHYLVKMNTDKEACYIVTEPAEIIGRYCLRYAPND